MDAGKIASIQAAKAPFFEPGLEDVIRETVAAGLLTVATDLEGALAEADVAMICVGTPSARNGDLSTEQLSRSLAEIGRSLPNRRQHLVIAIRSTVFPGTTEALATALLATHPDVQVVANPEFLREGVAIDDFMNPCLLVVGGDEGASRRVADLYRGLPVEPCLVSLRTAEMIKYCCNAFHAVKVSFANEVGALAEQLSVSAHEVMETLCRDTRLNISTAYLKPGFAFGGSCLPKDLRALTYRAARMDVKLPLLESVLSSNREHATRAVQRVLDLSAKRLGVFGLAFKENTDDLRESPVLLAVEQWIGKGRDLRIYDPHIRLRRIYGANLSFLLNAAPHIEKLLADSLESLLSWCDCVIVAQKPDAETRQRIAQAGKPIVDLVGAHMAVHTWPPRT
jgi:GDP-mannose 6-dehydrogenase